MPEFRILLACLTLLTIAQSCSEQTVDPDPPATPVLYSAVHQTQPQRITQLTIQPVHRRGPNPLPPSELSSLPLTIWIPSGVSQPFPLVIYSHGGGSRATPGESGEAWAMALAGAGYAVIAMHHMRRSPDDVKQNICKELGVAPADCQASVYVPYYESTDRPQDAVAVLDSLEYLGTRIGVAFDADRVAILGFSGGTNTTHYLAGGTRNAIYGISNDTAYFSMNDSRARAFLAMSCGAGTQGGWTAESLQTINRPFFCSTGSGDLSPVERAEFYEQLNGSDQYRMFINSDTAQHVVFNLETTGADQQAAQQTYHDWLIAAATAFLDAYVLEIDEARTWLKSDMLKRIMGNNLPEHAAYPAWSNR